MKQRIKGLRVDIDRLYKTTVLLGGNDGTIYMSWEILQCAHALRMAKAWAGKILGALGDETPYKNDGKRHDVKDIEPAADSSVPKDFSFEKEETEPLNTVFDELNYIERVDIIREMIKQTSDEALLIVGNPDIPSFHGEMVVKYLIEARFWLGYDLQRIKEDSHD